MTAIRTLSGRWRKERLGLSIIGCTLLVIVMIAVLIFHYQKQIGTELIRTQGLSLVRLISEIHYDQLQSLRTVNMLSVVYQSQGKSELAYISLRGLNGEPLSEVTAPGIIVPGVDTPTDPTAWIGERRLSLDSQRGVVEFHAPLLVNSELKGFVRIGYFEPGMAFDPGQLPFLASLALPVFLLAPLFYGLLRRELRPFTQANLQLSEHMAGLKSRRGALGATGDLAELLENFDNHLREARTRIARLEDERSTMIATTRIDSYKSTKIEAMIHSIPDAIIVFDNSGSITFANDKVGGFFEVAADFIIAEPLENWCKNDQVYDYISKIKRAPTTLRPPTTIKLADSGSRKTLSLTTFPVYESGTCQDIAGILLIIRDSTRESIAEVNREGFVAHISHELKTPLNSLLMYSEALLGPDGEDPAFRVEGLNVIYDETERMRDLINNLLNITKIETGSLSIDRTRVRLNDFLSDIFDNIRKGAKAADLEFRSELDNEVNEVAIDKGLMRVAINNLLTNAIKYNRTGGSVSLQLEAVGDTVRIVVRDTGIGISEEELKRIFDKFYRSESDEVRKRSGHGLGLALARDIIQLHNGQLTVSSTLGKGTEFVIEFHKQTELLRKAS